MIHALTTKQSMRQRKMEVENSIGKSKRMKSITIVVTSLFLPWSFCHTGPIADVSSLYLCSTLEDSFQ